MTERPDAVQIAARAIMLEDGCGLTIKGERVLCDDPRAQQSPERCYCRRFAKAAIDALDFDARLANAREQAFQDAAKVCDHWTGFPDNDIKYTNPRDYAVDAVEDIAEVLRSPELRNKALGPGT